MIFVTGDTHGSDGVMNRFNMDSFPEQKEMTKEDYVIVLGDWGVHWKNNFKNGKICLEDKAALPGKDGEIKEETHTLDWLEEKNFSTLFIDGNHECFPRLNSYPVVDFKGGLAHEIRPSVHHLMRGEIFEVNKKRIFAFGGASSHDIGDGILDPADYKTKEQLNKAIKKGYQERKMFRVKNLSWWEEELPNQKEMDNGWDHLEKAHYDVDFILTHTAPASMLAILGGGLYQISDFEKFLEQVKILTDYKYWFFGHLHENRRINEKDYLLYEQIIRIE